MLICHAPCCNTVLCAAFTHWRMKCALGLPPASGGGTPPNTEGPPWAWPSATDVTSDHHDECHVLVCLDCDNICGEAFVSNVVEMFNLKDGNGKKR